MTPEELAAAQDRIAMIEDHRKKAAIRLVKEHIPVVAWHEIERLKAHVEELRQKLSHDDCACSFDFEGDVCMVHSPAVQRLEAENAKLRAALEPFVRGLAMYESGTCITHGLPVPQDDVPAKNVYVGDQRKARAALEDK